MRHHLLKLLTRDAFVPFLRPLQRRLATVLMFHRFADREAGVAGHDPEILRRQLAWLRRHRFDVIPLLDFVDMLYEGRELERPAVVLTVDDAYDDFVRVAAPVLEEFDCPSTLFVPTGFVDGDVWMWWDKVEYVLDRTRVAQVELVVAGAPHTYALGSASERESARCDLVHRLKRVPHDDMRESIERLAAALEVELPAAAPAGYRPATWDQLADCARSGLVSYGPHSITHPVLSRVDDARSRWEIEGGWHRLRAMSTAAIPVIAFPDGAPSMFGPREQQAAVGAGLRAALSTVEDWACATAGANPMQGIFELPRFPYSEWEPGFRQVVTGLERGKRLVRSFWA